MLTPNATKSNRKMIAIAGGGIGGLALAVALRLRGFEPVVFERKSDVAIRTEGVFLTLAPNGLNALRGIGLSDAVAAAGIETTGLAFFNERGKQIGLMDYHGHGPRFGAPSATVRRGVLSALLLDRALAAGADVRFDSPIGAIRNDAESVAVDGERFDALVACDGLRSAVRTSVFPDLPAPVYSGLAGSGGVVDVPEVAPTGGLMLMSFGPRAFFGYIKAEGQPVYWFNTYTASEDETRIGDPAAYLAAMRDLHRDDPLDNSLILKRSAPDLRCYPIYDMPELARWSTGRVLLMGDAAHAVQPHSGQGASMAIEDALVLAACLDQSDVPEAFRRFESLRRARTHEAIMVGRAGGSQKRAQSWLARVIRDLVLPVFIPMGVKAQERLFRFRADETPLAMPLP